MGHENNNKDTLPVSNSITKIDRPLPSAPRYEDKSGYLAPRNSQDQTTEEPGYDELSRDQPEAHSPSYDTLQLQTPEAFQSNNKYRETVQNGMKPKEDGDCEYIIPSTDSGPKILTKAEDTYHIYFVLEKWLKQTGWHGILLY